MTKPTEWMKFKLTVAEKEMLRTLAVRSRYSTDAGLLRALIRKAYEEREMRRLARNAK